MSCYLLLSEFAFNFQAIISIHVYLISNLFLTLMSNFSILTGNLLQQRNLKQNYSVVIIHSDLANSAKAFCRGNVQLVKLVDEHEQKVSQKNI